MHFDGNRTQVQRESASYPHELNACINARTSLAGRLKAAAMLPTCDVSRSVNELARGVIDGAFVSVNHCAPMRDQLIATYSIVARDAATGELGVAVQSCYLAVGAAVPWGDAGVGVVATQAFANLDFGPEGLTMMREGVTPQDALRRLLEGDQRGETRQVALLDSSGRVATHTGAACVAAAGHLTDDGVSVQANMMAALHQALELAPEVCEIQLSAASAYVLQGRHDDARVLLQRVFDSRPLLAEWMHRMIAAGIIPTDPVLHEMIRDVQTRLSECREPA
jgi:hypothetical protein